MKVSFLFPVCGSAAAYLPGAKRLNASLFAGDCDRFLRDCLPGSSLRGTSSESLRGAPLTEPRWEEPLRRRAGEGLCQPSSHLGEARAGGKMQCSFNARR